MHPQLTLIIAQQHIADLHRAAADHNRLVPTASSRRAVAAPRRAAAAPVSFPRWLRRRLA